MRFPIALLLFALTSPAFAQAPESTPAPEKPPVIGPLAPNYQPFRVDLGTGWATIPAQGASGGGMSIEPKFNFLDKLSAGFRADLLGVGGGRVGAPGSGDVAVGQQFIAAGLLKVDYFYTSHVVRPWTSLAFGRYAINGQGSRLDEDNTSVEYTSGSYYGISTQVGLELARFRMSATYNHLFGARVVVVENIGGTNRRESYSSSYATVEIGIRLGGGRLNKR